VHHSEADGDIWYCRSMHGIFEALSQAGEWEGIETYWHIDDALQSHFRGHPAPSAATRKSAIYVKS